MRYEIRFNGTLNKALQRYAGSQIESAILGLVEARHNTETGIHNTRKRIKEVRSFLRLYRPDLPDDVYRQEQAELRAVANRLAFARDTQVMLNTWHELVSQYPVDLEPLEDKVRSTLQRRAVKQTQSAINRVLMRCMDDLYRCRVRAQTWELPSGYKLSVKRLGRIARKAFNSWDIALDSTEDQAFHDARKRFKDLLYSLRLYRPLYNKRLTKHETALKEFTEILGQHNDLLTLGAYLKEHGETLTAQDHMTLAMIFDFRKNLLLGEAEKPLKQAEKMYPKLTAFLLSADRM